MGERDHDRDRTRTDRPTVRARLTVSRAAEVLGISAEAVRQRIKRGTIPHTKTDGTVYVFVETDSMRQYADTTTDRTSDSTSDRTGDRTEERAELVEELRDRIAYLERQVEEEREARRRADTLMARLMDRVPEIEPPATQEPPGARESAMAGETRAEPPAASASPQTGVQRRSWWSRLLGR